jgi:hypothetical protein
MYDTGTGEDLNKMFARMTVGSHLALLGAFEVVSPLLPDLEC